MQQIVKVPILGLAVIGLVLLLLWSSSSADTGSSSQALLGQRSLNDLLSRGQIVIEAARGNGASTGLSVFASLQNLTDETIDIHTHLEVPLFFRNGGLGQDMLATQVYGRDGAFYRGDHGQRFIRVGPRTSSQGRKPVAFFAYCVDFEKDNPTKTERLSVESLPQDLSYVGAQIAKFEQQNDNYQGMAPQLALWHMQGIDLAKISTRFSYSEEDVRDMHTLLRAGN